MSPPVSCGFPSGAGRKGFASGLAVPQGACDLSTAVMAMGAQAPATVTRVPHPSLLLPVPFSCRQTGSGRESPSSWVGVRCPAGASVGRPTLLRKLLTLLSLLGHFLDQGCGRLLARSRGGRGPQSLPRAGRGGGGQGVLLTHRLVRGGGWGGGSRSRWL